MSIQASEKSIKVEFEDFLLHPDDLYVNVDIKKIMQAGAMLHSFLLLSI